MTTNDYADRLQADSLARLEAIGEMQRQLAGLTGEATSPDGFVRVRTTPGGGLLDLQIDERAMAHQGADLAALVLQLSAQATAEVGERMRAIVGSVVPPAELDAMLAGAVPESVRDEVDAELARRHGEVAPRPVSPGGGL
jgi:DNA-binding protein YbaB